MATKQSLLFSWANELPDLRRLALVLEALPDEALPARLAERRGRYPVRAAGDHRRASARAVAGSGTQPQPGARCAASARWTTRTSRRSTTTASRTSPEPRSTVPGSHNFSRASLLESGEPDDMVRQLREQGRAAGLRRAPRLRRQGRGQSRARPVARPARPPTPTGESARRPASTEGPAIFGERRSRGSATGCTWPPGTRSQWSSTSPKRREPRPKS